MIPVEEAKRILFSKAGKATVVTVDLLGASGCVLAESVFSPIDLPSFNQSAMDGYAVASVNLKNKKQFEIVGELKAGDAGSIFLQPGQAVRIFTGAEVPVSADSIVIQEKAERVNGSIYLSEDFHPGDCIRFKGSQIKKDELALTKDTFLNPAAIGFLAALGITQVPIYKKPEVSIIVTGNELIKPGHVLNDGQVYESNSFSLHAALHQLHIRPKFIFTALDEINELKNKIEKCLVDSDLIILTGGISVGKYDLVHDALKSLEVETLFYKVAQKPGKPFFSGMWNGKPVFALPGNPAAVLVCFYEYIYPIIRTMQGFKNKSMPEVKLKLLKTISKKEDRALFLRSSVMHDGVMPLDKQDSNMLFSFAEADSLIYVPIESEGINQGTMVEVHLLPFNK